MTAFGVIFLALTSGVNAAPSALPKCQDYYEKCEKEIYTWNGIKECGSSKKNNFLASFDDMISPEGIEKIGEQFDNCCSRDKSRWISHMDAAGCYCAGSAGKLMRGGFCVGEVK